jgi:hypothetical protein
MPEHTKVFNLLPSSLKLENGIRIVSFRGFGRNPLHHALSLATDMEGGVPRVHEQHLPLSTWVRQLDTHTLISAKTT